MEIQSHAQSIYHQVLELYGRYGIRSMTMDDISRELGISKKTLYQHIEDKTDLVNRVVDLDIRINQEFTEGLKSSGTNAIEDLLAINENMHAQQRRLSPTFYYDLKKYYPEVYRRWYKEKHTHIFTLISGNIEKGKSEGIYRENLNGSIIASLYIHRMEMLDESDPLKGMEEITSDWIREVFLYHLHGICNRRGLDYLQTHHSEFYEAS